MKRSNQRPVRRARARSIVIGRVVSWIVLTGAAAFSPADAQCPNQRFFGKWVAQYDAAGDGGAGPQMSIVMEPAGAGLHYRSRTINRDGRVSVVEYTGTFDGTLVSVVGTAGLLAPVALGCEDELTITAVYSRGLRAIANSRWVLGSDGRTLVVVTQSMRADGALVQGQVHFKRDETAVTL